MPKAIISKVTKIFFNFDKRQIYKFKHGNVDHYYSVEYTLSWYLTRFSYIQAKAMAGDNAYHQ